MGPNLFLGFAQNLVLPLAIVFCYSALLRRETAPGGWPGGRVRVGVLFGLGGVLAMIMPLQVGPGISIDNRIAPVALAGAFGGPVSAVVAVLITASYRVFLGGAGMWPGIASLISVGILGVLVGRAYDLRRHRFGMNQCLIIGLCSVLVTLPWTLLLPAGVGLQVLSTIALPVALMYPFAIMVIGALLLQALQHNRLAVELKTSEHRFRALFEQAPDAIIISDLESGRILDANSRATELTGRPHADLIGITESDLHLQVPGGGVDSVEGAQVATSEVRNVIRGPVPVEIRTTRIEIDHGQAVVGFFRDISDREQAQADAQLARSLFERIVQTADAAIVGLDTHGCILFFNRALERLTGKVASDVIGKPWREVGIRSDDPVTARSFADLLERGAPTFIEGPLRVADDRQTVIAWRCSISESAAFARVIAVGIDVTQQRLHEEHSRHAEKMQAIGQLAGGVAHDFNNQLQIITGYASILSGSTDEKIGSQAQAILDSCRRSADLTAKLLAFSRKGSPRREPVDLNALLRDSVTLMRPAMDRCHIEFTPCADPCPVLGDSGTLQNAILNLAFNARDATEGKGSVRISLRWCDLVPETFRAAGFTVDSGPGCILEFQDDGPGIPESIRARIFEPFFTTTAIGHGTGLGLAAVYGTILEHRGAVLVGRSDGGGAKFSVFLPRTRNLPAQDQSEAVRSPQATGERILVVEDEEVIRALIIQVLEGQGYAIVACPSGEAALTAMEQATEPFDLALVDLHLPGCSGQEVIAHLHQLWPSTRVLVSTGFGPQQITSVLREDPRVAFLMKPFDPGTLRAAVQQSLDGRRRQGS